MDSLPIGQGIEAFTGTIWHSEALELLKLLPDKSIDLILTDFPYSKTQAFYDKPVLDFTAIGKEMFRVIRQDGAVISTAAQPFTSKLVMLWERQFQYEWIWRKSRKTNFLNAKKMPLAAHESILVFGHKLPRYYPQMIKGEAHQKGLSGGLSKLYGHFNRAYSQISDEYYPDDVLDFKHDADISSKNENHPNAKPLELWQYLLNTYTLQGEIVLDPFCGGGVTAIACTNLDRRFICGDNHLPYVELSRERLQRHDPTKDTEYKTGDIQLSLFRDMKPE